MDKLIIGIIGFGAAAVGLTVADKENLLFNMNPSKRWFWERILQPTTIVKTVYVQPKVTSMGDAPSNPQSKYSLSTFVPTIQPIKTTGNQIPPLR
jgi:hypothetical protein